MTHEVEESDIRFLPTVLEEPGARLDLRYMKRRKMSRQDRNGDPLDGVINLFDVAIVLAVGFLLAALTGLGMTDLLTADDLTIVTNPGTDQMQVVVKSGDTIETLDLEEGEQVSGVGTLIGSFYQLADGTTVYVPSASTVPPGATPLPEETVPPGTVPTPAPTTVPGVTPTAPPMPSPGATGAPTGSTGDTDGVDTGAPVAAPTAEPGKKGDG
jgi:hypothetical protein